MSEDEQAMALGARIRELRIAAGFSQKGFSEAVGLHRACVARLERGMSCATGRTHGLPTLRTVITIARGLGVPAADLVSAVDGGAA